MIKNQAELNCFVNRGLGQWSFDTNQVFVLFQIIIAKNLSQSKKNEGNNNDDRNDLIAKSV